MLYDYLIVGAGISGLYTAYKLQKYNPHAKICIIESADYIGGRLYTITHDGLTFDAGGARFNNKQQRILELITELGLNKKKRPISSDIKYISIKPQYDIELEKIYPTINDFILDCKKYILHNKSITIDIIQNTTLADFADIYFSKKYPTIKKYLISLYPYYSEVTILNTLESINLFSNEFSNKVQYYVLDGGLQQLATHLATPSTTIHLKTTLETIKYNESIFTCNTSKKTYQTKNLILTIQKPALMKLHFISHDKPLSRLLNSISNEPLYRIYACFPPNKDTNKVWFHNLPKISTNLAIKYIIPMNYEKGLIMISYTDSKYAQYWHNKKTDIFETTLFKQLALLFPDRQIPKPKWYKHCYWSSGAGYWKPKYSRTEIMPQIINPRENMYICGENYSSHQAWVEGALETADMVLQKIMAL